MTTIAGILSVIGFLFIAYHIAEMFRGVAMSLTELFSFGTRPTKAQAYDVDATPEAEPEVERWVRCGESTPRTTREHSIALTICEHGYDRPQALDEMIAVYNSGPQDQPISEYEAERIRKVMNL